MTRTNNGILAIWNDCAAGREREYERWYRTEHLAERVGIEGFLSGWRYAALDAEPAYFTHYETRSPDVLLGAPYLQRLDDPTPLTRSIMSGVFVNATRSLCERVLEIGDQRGAFATVVRFSDAVTQNTLLPAARELATNEDVLRAEVWVEISNPASGTTSISTELALRGPDDRISACVLLHSATERESRAACDAAGAALAGAKSIGVYRLMCALLAAEGT